MKNFVMRRYFAILLVITLIGLAGGLANKSKVSAALTTYTAKSPGSVSQPAKGSTYIDPVFGTKILRVTDAADGGSGTAAYAYWPALNCNSTKMIIGLDYVPNLYNFDPNNLTFNKIGPVFSGDAMVWEGMTWSVNDPNTIYGISGYNSNTLLRAYNVSTKQYTFVHDFTASGELPTGTPAQMSKARSNDRYFSFHWCPSGSSTKRYAVVYDKQLNQTYKFDLSASYGMPNFDECRLDRDGNYLTMITGKEEYVWQFATQAPSARTVVAYDATQRAGGHYDLGSGFLLQSDLWGNNGNRLIRRPMNTPGSWSQDFDSGVTDWNTDHHLSMTGPNDTWALVSTETFNNDYSKPFANEVFLVKTDGSGEVQRIAHSRSSNSDYWNTPRAAISPDGKFAIYNSDWGGGHNDVYLAVLPAGIWGATSTPTGTPTVQATASVTAGIAPLAVSLTGAASSPNGAISSYNWTFGDGSTATGASVSHTYSALGTFTAVLTVKDSANQTATSAVSINVTSAPVTGVPVARFTMNKSTGIAPVDIIFDGSTSSSINGAINNFAWSFGDGQSASGKTVTHTFSAAGTFSVNLTVTDAAGKTASTSQTVTVTAGTTGGTGGGGTGTGTAKTVTFVNGDGKSSSATYDTSVMASYPSYTIDTSFDGRVGGSTGAATLIAMPGLIGSGADQIPAGAQITSATLSLSIYTPQATGITASRVLDPNNMGLWFTGATVSNDNVGVAYNYRDARSGVAKQWNSAGGNLASVLATPDATVTLTGSEATGYKLNLNVTASVAAWAAGAVNQGWAIRATTAAGSAVMVYDSQNATSVRPVLTVTYTTGTITPPTSTNKTVSLSNNDGQAGSATKDVTISEMQPTYTQSSIANNRVGSSNKYKTLVAFNNLIGTGTGQIPAGAKIVSATLVFSLQSAQASTLDLYRITDPDNKGMWYTGANNSGYNVGASFGNRNSKTGSVVGWSNSATSIMNTTILDNRVSIATGATLVSFDVTTSVAAWAAGAPNQGWLLSTTSTASVTIYDSAQATAKYRPVLKIVYSN